MTKLFLVLFLLLSSMAWVYNWVTSGRADQFILDHPHPQVTPVILNVAAQFSKTFGEYKTSAHYFRLIIRDFPEDKKIAKVYYGLAESYERDGKVKMALEQYAILKDSFTNTRYGRLGRIKFDKSRY